MVEMVYVYSGKKLKKEAPMPELEFDFAIDNGGACINDSFGGDDGDDGDERRPGESLSDWLRRLGLDIVNDHKLEEKPYAGNACDGMPKNSIKPFGDYITMLDMQKVNDDKLKNKPYLAFSLPQPF